MDKPQGWALPCQTAKKFHYFKNDSARSLCGNYLFFNCDPRAYEDNNHDHEQNCKACRTALAKESK